MTFAAIVDTHGTVVAHADRAREGQSLPEGDDLNSLLSRAPLNQLLAIYSDQGRNVELRQRLLLGGTEFGSIRIGVSSIRVSGVFPASRAAA